MFGRSARRCVSCRIGTTVAINTYAAASVLISKTICDERVRDGSGVFGRRLATRPGTL